MDSFLGLRKEIEKLPEFGLGKVLQFASMNSSESPVFKLSSVVASAEEGDVSLFPALSMAIL